MFCKVMEHMGDRFKGDMGQEKQMAGSKNIVTLLFSTPIVAAARRASQFLWARMIMFPGGISRS